MRPSLWRGAHPLLTPQRLKAEVAVMARAYMRRAPGVLLAGTGLVLAFALITISTLLRLILYAKPVALSVPATFWCLGWAVFALCALRSMAGPAPHPVLSAARG